MRKLFTLLCLAPFALLAQELDSLYTDSLALDSMEVVLPKKMKGVFIMASFNQAPNPGGAQSMTEVAVGLRYTKFSARFNYTVFNGEYQKLLIFPNEFNLIYAFGGGTVNYWFFSQPWLTASAEGSFGGGDMIWERLDTREDFLRDTFTYWQLGVSLEIPYLRYIRPGFRIGYQSLSDLDLPGINADNFVGVFTGFTVKIGYFNQ